MTQLMAGKKGIIFGVSNKRGIGYAIAKALHDAGAEIAFTYANELMEGRVRPIAEEMNSKLIMECDVTNEDVVSAVFDEYKKQYETCDFVIHAVAFANRDDLTGNFSDVSKEGWDLALGVSAYSLIPITRAAKPLMSEGGTVTALTYLGGEMYVPNYNIMGVAKAALESAVRYLAAELGSIGVRVNALSAGPVKTLAFKGIAGSDILLKINKVRSPLKRNITLEDVGNAGLYLSSDLSSGVSGETHHVDSGVHFVAISKEDAEYYQNM
mgnify:CR=1 FL=1